ncbi:sodium/hydrogen exchanger family protein [Rhizobium azibense]|uniref:Sodium/hydrogen exchanger family protein n=2 Tax=Rhizobium azibense TaxID=1136135 RepID=A0A4R3R2K0_9HYPH|nr:sodium/hydrogen exchanger family protein [Rhizobium azibense]
MRVQSYAVWSAVVFVLNIMAFLLMGMQIKGIIAAMPEGQLMRACTFAAFIVAIVVLVRFAVCIGYNRILARLARRRGRTQPATLKQAILAGWCGMRGLVTLATAFALPSDFPQRDTVVLTAFAVVLATLVIQGLTLSPLIRWLGLDGRAAGAEELRARRAQITRAGIRALEDQTGPEAELLRGKFLIEQQALFSVAGPSSLETYRKLALGSIAAQRMELERLRSDNELNVDEYNLLLEEIDWKELAVLPLEERKIEEI